MNPFIKALLQAIAIMLFFIGIAYYVTCIRPQEKINYDINKERFKTYNDSPLYFHKYIKTSVVYKQKHKYKLVKVNEQTN